MTEQLGIQIDWKQSSLANFPRLKEGELHLWWLPLVLTDEQAEQALSLLSDIQRDKYHRRRTPELKHAYLAGRYYLLSLLGAYSHCSAEDVELSYSRLNKPYLSKQGNELEFNFTDTINRQDYYGLFGFSRAHTLGVDIENRSRPIDLRKLIEQRYTTLERHFVMPEGDINQARGLSIWTRKEAYGKATGQGINFKMNLQNLVMNSGDDGNTAFNFEDIDHRPWRCVPLNLSTEFVASCVYSGHKELSISGFNQLLIE